jgi:hypothetical protein
MVDGRRDGNARSAGDREPGKSARASWSAPRIVDYGSIRHLVRKGTGDINEGVGIGSGQKIRSH